MSYEYDEKSKQSAIAAVKDVLYMYKTLIEYNGFFDDFGSEDGAFDPYYYIDCNAQKLGISDEDANLLHEGSAIKIICGILFSWGQGNHPQEETYYVKMFQKLVDEKRLKHIPELRDAIQLAIDSDDEFWLKSGELYEKYVVGFFSSLCIRQE